MNNILKYALMLLTGLNIWSCQRMKVIPSTPNNIFPLEVGNRWTYRDSVFYSEAGQAEDTLIREFEWEVSRKGYRDFELNNGDYERLELYQLSVTEQGQGVTYELRPEAGGILNYGFQLSEGNTTAQNNTPPTFNCEFRQSETPTFMVKYPTVTGDSLKVPAFIWGGCGSNPVSKSLDFYIANHPGLMLKTEDLAELVSTPVGNFMAVNYGSQWWAPGAGLVRAELQLENVPHWENAQTFLNFRVIRELVDFAKI